MLTISTSNKTRYVLTHFHMDIIAAEMHKKMSTDIKYSLFLRVEGNTISNTILQTKNEVQALTDSGKTPPPKCYTSSEPGIIIVNLPSSLIHQLYPMMAIIDSHLNIIYKD